MKDITIVYGPNKFNYDCCLKEYIEELPSSFKLEHHNLTKKDSDSDKFLSHFSLYNLFAPKRLFVVEVYSDQILSLASICSGNCSKDKKVIFYCPDLYIKKSSSKSYKSKRKSTSKSSSSAKTKESISEIIDELKELEDVELIEANYIQDYDEAWEFCNDLIKSYNIPFKSKEDIELTIEHLISCSQLTSTSKGVLTYITSNTEVEDILYEQNLICNNLKTISVYCEGIEEIDFDEIEDILFSIVNKTQSKKFMNTIFKCTSSREAARIVSKELSILSKDEVRSFLNLFRYTLEQNLKMSCGEYYIRDIVSPIKRGNLKITNPEKAYVDLCSILDDYSCSPETHINKFKLFLYTNFR